MRHERRPLSNYFFSHYLHELFDSEMLRLSRVSPLVCSHLDLFIGLLLLAPLVAFRVSFPLFHWFFTGYWRLEAPLGIWIRGIMPWPSHAFLAIKFVDLCSSCFSDLW